MEKDITQEMFDFIKINTPNLDDVIAVKLLDNDGEYGSIGEFYIVKCLDVDSAFVKITGRTKAEFDAERKKEHLEYKKHKRKHKKAIPELTKGWIEKGNEILAEKYHETWVKCVPIRLGDLYEGMELKATLDIVKELNAGCELEVAKGIIEGQGHSGMSFRLVCSMVKSFCDRGTEFASYVLA